MLCLNVQQIPANDTVGCYLHTHVSNRILLLHFTPISTDMTLLITASTMLQWISPWPSMLDKTELKLHWPAEYVFLHLPLPHTCWSSHCLSMQTCLPLLYHFYSFFNLL